MGAVYALTATPFFEKYGWVPYLKLNAEASGVILRRLGENATVSGRTVSSPRAALLIERGCDAIHPSALFLSALVALPAPLWKKLCGALAGTALLMLTNLVRIVTLFYVRIYYPSTFEVVHVEVWQIAFIFLVILLWVAWALWAVRLPAGNARGAPSSSAKA
jgi:exosortase/archaeosortase family protein